jgi:hypothetical protein
MPLDAEAMLPDDVLAEIATRDDLLDRWSILVNAARWRRAIAGLEHDLYPPGKLLADGERIHLSRRDVLFPR